MLSPPGTRADVSGTAEGHEGSMADTPRGRFARPLAVARAACGVVLFAFVVAAVVNSWDEVHSAISNIEPSNLLLAEALIVAGLWLSVLTWRRTLVEFGQNVRLRTAAKIYLLGQLGKYLPGSLWALAAQAELGRSAGIPRARGATASVVAVGVNVATGMLLGSALASRVSDDGMMRAGLVLALVVVLVACLTPPLLTRLIDTVLRVARRPPLPRAISWRGIGAASAWSIATWVSYGLSVWIIAIAVGAPTGETLPLCLAGVPLAVTAGVLVVVAPSGIGVREAVIVAALAPVLSHADAFSVAIAARFLFTIGDLLAAAAVIPLRHLLTTS